MRKNFLIFVFLSAFMGCATTKLRMLENSGLIKTDLSNDPKFDWIVAMQGVDTFGWNGNLKEDRQKMLIEMFGRKCKSLDVGDEMAVRIENDIDTWVMKVKCQK